jgi:stearoyl-CoA desaturase (Delta-9 desaturase)
MQIVIYTLIVTHITIAGVTVFLHRSQAHRSLDLHAIPSHFFRFWLWMTTGMVTKQWVAIHRKHHAKCETEADPHSPQTRGIGQVMLRGAELYRTESKNQETISKYGHGTPDDWIEKNLYTKYSAHGVALLLITNFCLFGVLGLTVWAIQMIWIPFFAAGVINGLGHYWGYRNFESSDASTNISPWGIIIGGEELHNNHHTFATSARLSNKWYEFDIGWLYIKLMSYIGWAHIKKIAPVARISKPALLKNHHLCDLETLNTLIHNRYDAMARYQKIIASCYEQEADKIKEHAKDLLSSAGQFKNLLIKPAVDLSDDEQQAIKNVLEQSKSIQVLYQMSQELQNLWSRSSLSKEQLLENFQEWCAKAEQSGHDKLVEFSKIIRNYRPQTNT